MTKICGQCHPLTSLTLKEDAVTLNPMNMEHFIWQVTHQVSVLCLFAGFYSFLLLLLLDEKHLHDVQLLMNGLNKNMAMILISSIMCCNL